MTLCKANYINGEAIYETRKIEPYYSGSLYFTQKKDKSSIYAIYTIKDGETLPDEIELKAVQLPENPKVEVLGYKGRIRIKKSTNGYSLSIPNKLQTTPPHKYAVTFRIY